MTINARKYDVITLLQYRFNIVKLRNLAVYVTVDRAVFRQLHVQRRSIDSMYCEYYRPCSKTLSSRRQRSTADQLQFRLDLIAACLCVADGRLQRRGAALGRVPQIVRDLLQRPACVPCSVREVMPQIVE